jgi:hypothetical protein
MPACLRCCSRGLRLWSPEHHVASKQLVMALIGAAPRRHAGIQPARLKKTPSWVAAVCFDAAAGQPETNGKAVPHHISDQYASESSL